ncbi:MAG: hypothetical protein ACFCU5_10520 [Pleurocapsa sp.]
MKLHKYWINLICLGSLLPFMAVGAESARAGCAIVAPTNQVSISGSHDGTTQENSVTTSHDDNCLGNAVVAPTNQVGIGSGEIQQSNQGQYFVGGGEENQTGISGPVIEVTPTNQVDVYSPAHDPNFINDKLQNVPQQ